ncbi:hypothetical protein SLEP1_g10875 [Rubroshorea leprosula]|uniref:Transmembrane 9 superfamily member n=1 Tax=Rubroshorea leprosula TaxID=152421 RepID=A0AAV5IJH8_9ROSI|nr:hypothetical protein SLEP1_g10875 [Rubroshorea leprosula]
MGDQIDNSPYWFRMNVNESVYLCTTNPLSENEVKLLKQRTRDLYRVNMILDNLPAMRFANQNSLQTTSTESWRTGFPVGRGRFGFISESDNKKPPGYEIVGFEVVPCSVKDDPNAMTKLKIYDNVPSMNCPLELEKSQIIREQERISFTYEVEFVKSDIRWPSRWDA